MNRSSSSPTCTVRRPARRPWIRGAVAALAGFGLACLSPAIRGEAGDAPDAEGAAVRVKKSRSADVEETLDRAMQQAELAVGRAAEVGKAVALRLTSTDSGPRALVLPSESMSPADARRMTEDLGIMRRILDKAASTGRESRQGWVGFLGEGTGRNPDAFYLDGFGALFVLRVGFPLSAPPAATVGADAEPTDRVWETTRRELKGGGGAELGGWESVLVKGLREEELEYDAGRVNTLRESLIQALRHARNLGVLRPEETVAVSVLGTPASGAGRSRTLVTRSGRVLSESGSRAKGADAATDAEGGGVPSGTVLTLRARKADIDAFAKGDLSAEAFAKKIRETLQ